MTKNEIFLKYQKTIKIHRFMTFLYQKFTLLKNNHCRKPVENFSKTIQKLFKSLSKSRKLILLIFIF